jgi:hypothetical protein
MSRAKILISAGSSAVVLSITLLAWVNDSARPSVIPEVLGLLLLVPGMLALFAGSIAFCAKEEATQVLRAGVITSGVALVLVPLLARIMNIDANVHDWTGLVFFFLWVPACVLGPVFLLVGAVRLLLRRRQAR